ncbi:transcriptional regulator with XRE-family HTH domain [Paenibacillus cellulosilyticus]|uniref:Transcriptional regulator with XRE-family HTH domain n=1 Tax=Paenibacillus cellulosilyticus TaxID=375489 RepID=A0A2V2YTT7_9BACL|nr:helix-turn-helix transcriptional regulator [Paenibacillus cellulosilyticus]PWW02918.1 transcriptional regulator with XRE-family HTH domain [Paenibacillus cellulosilyticus]QKS45826.1 helix-turn-helix transcriptional regulator [Paenibacillus cellulosilyticus]
MPSYNLNHIAAAMKKLRADKGVTIGQIAGKTGISYEVLSRLEKGTEKNVAPSTIILLAQYFEVTTEELEGHSTVERYLVTGGRKIDLSDYSEAELTEIENFMVFLRWRRAEENRVRNQEALEREQKRQQRAAAKQVPTFMERLARFAPNS